MSARIAHVANVDLMLRMLLLPQLRWLRDEGFEVTAISAPGPLVPDIEAAGIRHIPWRSATRAWDPRADAAAFRELGEILRRERFDLVHMHNPKAGILGRIAARRAGVPAVVNTVHGLYATPTDRARRKGPVLALEALAARCSDLELYQSREDLEWARRVHVLNGTRAVHLGNGIDLRAFDPGRVSAERRAEVRRELGVRDGDVLVVTVARLVAEKGLRELMAAARMLGDGVRIAVVGPHEPEKADGLRPDEIAVAPENVVFTGWRDDVRDVLAAADVFVLASWREGMPRSAIEAAAMGKPLVLTGIRGCREVARDGVEGLLVPPRQAGPLADAVGRLARDPELRDRLGAAARARALEQFDEQRVFDTIAHEYERLLGRPRGAAESVAVRAARAGDVPAMARLHAQELPDAFLSSLGDGFLRRFYRALVADSGAVAVVAVERGRVIGFGTAAASTREFSRRFYRRHGLSAAVAAAPALVRVGGARGIRESARYAGERNGFPDAEFLTLAVDRGIRRRGVGRMLAETVFAELAALGIERVTVMIADENEGSTSLFTQLGVPLERHGPISVHRGTPSTVWVAECRS